MQIHNGVYLHMGKFTPGSDQMQILFLQIHTCKGPLTIWPVYAYTLATQNTVIKLPMLILYTEDNIFMSYEEIHVQIFTNSVIIW